MRAAARHGKVHGFHGAHTFRHAAATKMINADISIKDIADILGHARIDTAAVYAKVDITGLRKVVALWPRDGK